MKQILYMAGKPIKHPGVEGRELPLRPAPEFNAFECEHIFMAAGRMEKFINYIARFNSVADSFREFLEAVENDAGHELLERRIRSYILEVDILLKHWEKFFGHRGKGEDFKNIMHKEFDSCEAYALICIFRNYLVHSSDIMHGQHKGFDGIKIWADRDLILNDYKWSAAKKELLKKQDKKIDLIKVIQETFPSVDRIHNAALELLIDKQVKEDCDYLCKCTARTILINATDWFVFDFKGHELVNMPSIIGGVPGIGLDYYRLNWNAYKAIKAFVDEKGI